MATQGGKYWYGPRAVIAMQTVAAGRVKVRELDPSEPTGMGPPLWVDAAALAPAAMRYYGGEARP